LAEENVMVLQDIASFRWVISLCK